MESASGPPCAVGQACGHGIRGTRRQVRTRVTAPTGDGRRRSVAGLDLWDDGGDGEPAGWSRPVPDGGHPFSRDGSRKVGTPQGRVLANGQSGRPAGKCHREQTADGDTPGRRTGKGETVR